MILQLVEVLEPPRLLIQYVLLRIFVSKFANNLSKLPPPLLPVPPRRLTAALERPVTMVSHYPQRAEGSSQRGWDTKHPRVFAVIKRFHAN